MPLFLVFTIWALAPVNLFSSPNYAVVNGNDVILRSNPDAYSLKIGVLNSNETVTVNSQSALLYKIGSGSYFWYNVTRNNKEKGWVYGKFLVRINKIIINNTGIGKYGIGTPYLKFIPLIPHTKIITNNDEMASPGLLLYYKGEKYLEIGDKNYGKSNIVQLIRIFSDRFITSNGIYAGLSINDLTNILKEQIIVKQDIELGYESIIPPVFQTKNPDKNKPFGIVFEIFLKSYDDQMIGIYNTNEYETKSFRTNGYVTEILIYNYY